MKKKQLIILFLLYGVTRIIKLDMLPIFADEAIYLRWAGMIYHDPQQFLFLPMYDGKTPLFIWLLIPVTRIFLSDPLLGGRLLVVIFGGLTAWLIMKITKLSGGDKTGQIISGLLYIFIPFSFFFGRMSLIDGPLTFILAAAYYFSLIWSKQKNWQSAMLTGFCFGLALLTKTSALYALPVFGLIGIKNINRKTWLQFLGAGVLAMGMLASLRISALFPFLFNRSSDFAFSVHEIVTKPIDILSLNIPRMGMWLWIYLTPGIVTAFLSWKKSKALIGQAGLFLLPFALTGKLLTSRYLLPSIIWFIPAMGLGCSWLLSRNKRLGWMVISGILIWCVWFIRPLYFDLDQSKLSVDDKRQYLSEWSAGFGIPEVRDYLKGRVDAGKKVIVATEGYFGTLPDGLFVYFSETSRLQHMEIFGAGQPIMSTPPELLAKREKYDEAYLVVNQNRLNYNYDQDFELISHFEKPNNGAPLLLLRMKL